MKDLWKEEENRGQKGRREEAVNNTLLLLGENVQDQIRFVAIFAPYKLATVQTCYKFWICNPGPDHDYKSKICSRFVASLYAGAPKKTQQGMHISLKSVFEKCSVQTVFRIYVFI